MFGFGFSKEKSRTKAEGYLQQNKLPNAIAEYEKILQVEPRDLAILNQVGDIYARLGQNEKAIERFRVVAESYVSDGATLKAIALYKKITKLDTNGLPAMEKLAELYRKQGLVADARSMLLQTAEAYTRRSQSKETLRLLKQLVLFDPENVQVICRTADLMIQGGQKNEAKEMLTQTASTLIERHALGPSQKLLDKIITLDRGNLRAQELRAQVTLELGDAEKATELYEAIPDLDSRVDGLRNLLAAWLKLGNLDNAYPIARKLASVHHDTDGMLQIADALYKNSEILRAIAIYNEFAAELLAYDKEGVLANLHGAVSRVRSDPDALQTIYNLFQRAGETSMIAEVLELLAHACVQSDQIERARDAYKELIELEPDSSAHVQAYRQVCARLGPDAQPAPVSEAPPQDQPRSLEDFRASHEPELPAQNYQPQVEEIITAALSEAEIYDSFSSKTRGIAVLERALQSAPEDLRLNRTLALLYRQEGDAAKSNHCYSTMQRILENLGAIEAADYYANLTTPGQTTTWEAAGSEFTARDFDIAVDDSLGGTEEIDLSAEWESVWPDNPAVESPLPEAAAPAPLPEAASAAAPAVNVEELLEEVRFCLAQQIWDEAGNALSRLALACPGHPELPELRSQLQAAAAPAASAPEPSFAPVEVIEVTGDPLSAAPLYDAAPLYEPETPAPAAGQPDEFILQQPSLSSLAAELGAELGDEFAPEPISQPEPMPFVPPPPAVIPAPEPAAALSEPDPLGLVPFLAAAAEVQPEAVPSVFGDLLADFERDLDTPQDHDDDPETHFNLGIAFREMGLLDEAIGELQKVCHLAGNGLSPARTQQAYIWLATCFVEKSVPEAALKWFHLALETAPNEESRTAVNYELASAYESAGRKREALDRFLEVYGSNIDYRDVASRIRELRATV